MMPTTALVVAESSEGQPELERALRAADFDVRHIDAARLAANPDLAGRPDVALISASLGLRRVALLSRRLAEATARPSSMVFADGDLDALESCVRAGFDYVGPPFSATLVRSRLLTSWGSGRLRADSNASESVRDYQRDLNVGRDVQAGFLPDALPMPPGWRFAARFRPAGMVAGDFYDGFELVNGRRLGFVVADVCDKGIGAALFMALIRTLLRHTAEQPGSGSYSGQVGAEPLMRAVDAANDYLIRNHLRQGYFVTLFFGVLDPASGSLLYINGGHHPPVLIRAGGAHSLLPPTGPAVGMLPDSDYSVGHAVLGPGDSLLAYTDGVVEARDPSGDPFGMDRLLTAAGPARSATAMLESVDRGLRRHVGEADQSDDVTMLVLHRLARA